MASLSHTPERPRKPWRLDWTERDGRRTTMRFRTKREAQAFAAALDRGVGASTARMILEDWLAQWLETHGPGWESRTLRERVRVIELHIAPHLGRMRIGEITRPDVRRWRASLQSEGRTPKVANKAVLVLSAAMGAAVADDVLSGNPCQGLRPLPVPPVEREPATLDEVEGIRIEMSDVGDRLACSLMAYAGLRPSELRALEWRDVRPQAIFVQRAADDQGRVKTTKTKSVRALEILEPIREDLAAVERGGPEDLVLPRVRGWDNWTMRIWRPARRMAECEPAPYALRHTFASLLIAQGMTVFEVAQRLGHATPNLTMSTYGHLFAEAQIEAGQTVAEAGMDARRRAADLKADRDARRMAVRDRAADGAP